MAIPLNVNGAVFEYPVNFDEDWGIDATGWAQAVTNGMLQRAGGNFPLTADVNFGASFGLKAAYFETRVANPAITGLIRLSKTDTIDWRNNANSADLPLGIDGSDNLTFNGLTIGFTGSVNPGTANQLAYYATSSNSVSGLTSITANKALISNASGLPIASSVSNTTLAFLDATSSVQTQLNSISAVATAALPETGGTMSGIIAMGGNKITGLANGTNPQDAINVSQLLSSALVPPGAMLDFAGTSAPSGWLLCDGAAYSPSTYPNLFSAIGYTWGTSATTIARIQAVGNQVPNSGPITVTISPSVIGNILVVANILNIPGFSVTGITDNKGNTYTQASATAGNTNQTSDLWYVLDAFGGVTSVTITTNGSGASILSSAVIEYSGVASVSPIGAQATQSGTGTPLSPTLSAGGSNDLLVSSCYNSTASTWSTAVVWGTTPCIVADFVVPSPGLYQATFTSPSTSWTNPAMELRTASSSTDFLVPDMRRRVGMGSGGSGTGTIGNAVGNIGGEETHTLSVAETPSGIPVAITDPGHPHNLSRTYANLVGGSASGGVDIPAAVGGTAITASSNTTGITATAGGSGTPLNVIQPSAIVLKIIKT